MIRTINCNKSGEHEKKIMKIKFDSDDNFPFNKPLKSHVMAIIIRFAFEENGKYYLQIFFKRMFVWVMKMLNVKSADYRCILWGISRNEAISILNNSVIEDNGVL